MMASDLARRSVAAIVFDAIALGLAPDAQVTVDEWAEEKREVAAESSPRPGRWSNKLVPYLREIMYELSPAAVNTREVTFAKSAQVAGTEAGINLFGHTVDVAPAPMLIVLPTIDEAKKYVDIKLGPAIDATPALKSKVKPQRARSERGSTTLNKKFAGGFAQITGANSSKGLQMISVKILIKEELSEWPEDVDGRGDPDGLAEKRTTAFRRVRKVFNNSTPGIKGSCRITKKYEASDQRRYFVPCPHCKHEQALKWENLTYSRTFPHDAAYTCEAPGCSKPIEHHHKEWMVANGRWIATKPGPGRQPGFHINQLYSPFVSWDDTVVEWLNAEGDPTKEKVFTQQVLGEAYEAKGDAPDYLKLFGRREEFRLGRVPYGGLFLTCGVDVQGDRLEFGVWAWGIGKTSWLVDKGVVVGDTANLATWSQLAVVLGRKYEDAHGNLREIEATAIDSGFNTQTVYAFVRRVGPRVLAIKGMPGHLAPALGTPTKQEVNWKGEKIRGGVLLWPVGTWTLKSEFYAFLRKTIDGPIDGVYPVGYVHYPAEVDETYLQQSTAEFLVSHESKGFTRQEWVKKKDARNEALDIRVYAAAAAVHLGIDRLTPAAWAKLAAERGSPPDPTQGELAALWAPAVVPAAPAAEALPAEKTGEAKVIRLEDEEAAPASNWIGDRARNWFS
jgi:phage terminase large subunit GpA-like protein